MFKVLPVRGNCPICKGEFINEDGTVEKPKKKGAEEEPYV